MAEMMPLSSQCSGTGLGALLIHINVRAALGHTRPAFTLEQRGRPHWLLLLTCLPCLPYLLLPSLEATAYPKPEKGIHRSQSLLQTSREAGILQGPPTPAQTPAHLYSQWSVLYLPPRQSGARSSLPTTTSGPGMALYSPQAKLNLPQKD